MPFPLAASTRFTPPDARFPGQPRDPPGGCYMDGTEGLRARPHRTGGFATPTSYAAGAGNEAVNALTFEVDPSVGAGQLRCIVAPIAKRGLIAAWVIAYIFCLRDLGITLVVYPPGFDTLPVRILTLMANGAPSLIAALCVILIVVTLLPLFVAALWQARAGRPP